MAGAPDHQKRRTATVTSQHPERTDAPDFQSVRQLEERPFGPALEHFTDGFFACDADWRLVAVNSAAEGVLGLRREELIGREHTEVFPDALRTCVLEGCHRVADGQPHACEQFHAPSAAGCTSAVSRRGGGMFCYFLDITDRKRAEAALRASEERYRSLVETAKTSSGRWTTGAGSPF